jgi:hypothetical protein
LAEAATKRLGVAAAMKALLDAIGSFGKISGAG